VASHQVDTLISPWINTHLLEAFHIRILFMKHLRSV